MVQPKLRSTRHCTLSMAILALVMSSLMACAFFNEGGLSDMLRNLANRLDVSTDKDKPIEKDDININPQSGVSQSGQAANNAGAAEGDCAQYSGLVIYSQRSSAGNAADNRIVIADDQGNEMLSFPDEKGDILGFSDPAWSPDHCRVVFSAKMRAENNINLFSMNPDGSGITQLTSASGFEHHADWSPDGKKIVYVVGNYPQTQSGGQTGSGGQPATPQQSSAAVVGQAQSNTTQTGTGQNSNSDVQEGGLFTQLWTMNADGSDQRLLTNADQFLEDPEWSPDGSRIVFSCKNPGNPQQGSLGGICVINPDGSGFKRLTPEDKWGYLYPTWSPDSRQIAFDTNSFDAESQFGIMNADGSGIKMITVKNVDCPASQFKKWSADGKRIIYHNITATMIDGKIYNDLVFILDLESGKIRPLTGKNAVSERFPDW